MTAGTSPLLEVVDLKKHFPIKGGLLSRQRSFVYAVDGVTFSLHAGETLALVGESGCGKSTVGRSILNLIRPTAGQVRVDGRDIAGLPERDMRPYRRRMQIIFQDPYASLTPQMSAGEIIEEPLRNFGVEASRKRRQMVAELLVRVGLRAEDMRKYPHEFSGGQRQRIGIARAMAATPDLVICDEPVSALDVSVRAQVINLLIGLQEEKRLAYLFISHDLAVVEHVSHHVAVMYLGRIVEIAPADALFDSPVHPYTRALLSAVPIPDPAAAARQRMRLQGEIPSPSNPPSGCHFRTRCPFAEPRCAQEVPELTERSVGHRAACLVF
jgi:oligopeptide transport system ATP-binding protein